MIRAVAHHGEELGVVNDAILVLVSLFDDGVDLLFRHGLSQSAEHDGQLPPVDITIAVLTNTHTN